MFISPVSYQQEALSFIKALLTALCEAMAGVDLILYAKLTISNRNIRKISAVLDQYSVDCNILLTSVRHISLKNNHIPRVRKCS